MSSTDSAEETANMCFYTPPKKRPKKLHFNINEKNVIMNIYKTQLEENPLLPVDELVRKAGNIAGVSSSSVYAVMREYKQKHYFSVPKPYPSRKKIIDMVDDFDLNAIRRKVHQFFFRNEMPTINSILKDVNDDPDLPNFKRSTFHKLLKKLSFKFLKRGRNSLLLEKPEIVLWRREYLRKIRTYRRENRKIYYLDETWVNAGHTKSKIWVDESITSSRQAFLDGLSTGLKNPSGKNHIEYIKNCSI